jgi:hypothetical protein
MTETILASIPEYIYLEFTSTTKDQNSPCPTATYSLYRMDISLIRYFKTIETMLEDLDFNPNISVSLATFEIRPDIFSNMVEILTKVHAMGESKPTSTMETSWLEKFSLKTLLEILAVGEWLLFFKMTISRPPIVWNVTICSKLSKNMWQIIISKANRFPNYETISTSRINLHPNKKRKLEQNIIGSLYF